MRLFVFMELSRSAAGIKDARQSSPIVGEGSTASACVRDARTKAVKLGWDDDGECVMLMPYIPPGVEAMPEPSQ